MNVYQLELCIAQVYIPATDVGESAVVVSAVAPSAVVASADVSATVVSCNNNRSIGINIIIYSIIYLRRVYQLELCIAYRYIPATDVGESAVVGSAVAGAEVTPSSVVASADVSTTVFPSNDYRSIIYSTNNNDNIKSISVILFWLIYLPYSPTDVWITGKAQYDFWNIPTHEV